MTEELSFRERLRDVYETREQQRSLLRHLFTSPYAAQKYFNRATDDLFDSPERRWFVRTARRVFHETSSLFNERVLSGELDLVFKFADEQDTRKKRLVEHPSLTHTSVMTEWNLVQQASVTETPEWLLTDLERKKRATEAIASIQGCVDLMTYGQSDEAISKLCSNIISLRNKASVVKPVRLFTDMSWRLELVKNKQQHPEMFAGMMTQFDTFDRKTGGLFRGELFLVSGHTGMGKSTCLRSIIFGLLRSKLNVLLVVNEEVEEQVTNKFDAMVTKMEYQKFKRAALNEADVEYWQQEVKLFEQQAGRLFIQEIPQFTTSAEIESTLVDLLQQGNKIDVVVLDYLDHLKPIQKAWSETDEQNKSVAEFKDLCMRYRVGGITATQADTQSFEKESMHSYNVRGSKQKSGAANVVMFIKQLETDDDKDEIEWKIIITKNRDGPSFHFYVRFHTTTGIVKEVNAPVRNTRKAVVLKPIGQIAGSQVADSKKTTTRQAVVENDPPVIIPESVINLLQDAELSDDKQTEGKSS
jgi:replicative DNA helicase